MERYYEGGRIPWVKSGELREDLIIATEEHVTEVALKESSIKLLTRPLYIVRLGGIGDGFRPKIRSHPMGLLLN
jgi:type I restriction enzyme, S subunit